MTCLDVLDEFGLLSSEFAFRALEISVWAPVQVVRHIPYGGIVTAVVWALHGHRSYHSTDWDGRCDGEILSSASGALPFLQIFDTLLAHNGVTVLALHSVLGEFQAYRA